ncbi:hypothetical protein C8T65DRAFT_667174 [Cerioporus squamosus]|nr:hypothetical protein C8T65DRAFT_667174 [Cerioporus squamosus]
MASLLIMLSVSNPLWLLAFLGARWVISAVVVHGSFLGARRSVATAIAPPIFVTCHCTLASPSLSSSTATISPDTHLRSSAVADASTFIFHPAGVQFARVSSERISRASTSSEGATSAPCSRPTMPPDPHHCRDLQSIIGSIRSRSASPALVRISTPPARPDPWNVIHIPYACCIHPGCTSPSLPGARCCCNPYPSVCSAILHSCPVYTIRALPVLDSRGGGCPRLFTGALHRGDPHSSSSVHSEC